MFKLLPNILHWLAIIFVVITVKTSDLSWLGGVIATLVFAQIFNYLDLYLTMTEEDE